MFQEVGKKAYCKAAEKLFLITVVVVNSFGTRSSTSCLPVATAAATLSPKGLEKLILLVSVCTCGRAKIASAAVPRMFKA